MISHGGSRGSRPTSAVIEGKWPHVLDRLARLARRSSSAIRDIAEGTAINVCCLPDITEGNQRVLLAACSKLRLQEAHDDGTVHEDASRAEIGALRPGQPALPHELKELEFVDHA